MDEPLVEFLTGLVVEVVEVGVDGLDGFEDFPELHGFDGDLCPFEGGDFFVGECFVDGHGGVDDDL